MRPDPSPAADLDFTHTAAGTLPVAVDADGRPVPAAAAAGPAVDAAGPDLAGLTRGDWTAVGRGPGRFGGTARGRALAKGLVVAGAVLLFGPLLLVLVLMLTRLTGTAG